MPLSEAEGAAISSFNWQFNWEGIPSSMFANVKVLHFNQPKPWAQYKNNLPVSDTNYRFYEDWKRIREKV